MKNQTQPQTDNEFVEIETKKEWIKPELLVLNINNDSGANVDAMMANENS